MKVMCKMRLQRSRNWESTVAIRREKEREREVDDKKQRQRERQNRNRENVCVQQQEQKPGDQLEASGRRGWSLGRGTS